MFRFLRAPTDLQLSKRPYVVSKDRASGERRLFELAYSAKHEVSWAHIMGANTWINLTADYRRMASKDGVAYQVTSRPLASSILGAALVFYHTHPKKAFDEAFGMLTKHPPPFDMANPFSSIERNAYGYLLSTFHLPSVQDIEASAYLEERHGPGVFSVIVSNVGASVTRIRNPPEPRERKMSVAEIAAMYKKAHSSIPPMDRGSRGDLINAHYGVINEACNGYVIVADLTSVALLQVTPLMHTELRWLEAGEPLQRQLETTGMHHLMLVIGAGSQGWEERSRELDGTIKRLTDLGSDRLVLRAEAERLNATLRGRVSDVLKQLVGSSESADTYAEFVIRGIRDFYGCVDRSFPAVKSLKP